MKSILEKLYDGEIHPAEDLCGSKEYQRFHNTKHTSEHDQIYKDLKALDGDVQRRLLEYMEHQTELLSAETPAAFVCGFRLGARIMIEIFQATEPEE